MAEYIERDKVLEAIFALPPKMDEQGYGWLGRMGLWQMIRDFPAADVQPVKHGYWEYETDYCLVCSECGNPAEINGITGEFMESPYCNECGARMDGKT